MPVFSSDGKNLGQVAQVERGPDGKIQSVQIQIGRLLGIGEKTITIDGSKLEQLQDRIRLMMSSDQVRSLPEQKVRATAHRGRTVAGSAGAEPAPPISSLFQK